MATHIGRALMIVLVATVAGGNLVSAQAAGTHPNFTGVWLMDAAHSDASSFTPKTATYTVVQRGDSLTFDRVSVSPTDDTTKSRMTWGIDGKPWKNTLKLVGIDAEATSVLAWQHDTLAVHTSSRPSGGDLQQIDLWSLSADGDTLTMQRQAIYNGQSIGSPTLRFLKRR